MWISVLSPCMYGHHSFTVATEAMSRCLNLKVGSVKYRKFRATLKMPASELESFVRTANILNL